MTQTQQRRPGGEPRTAAVVSLAATETSVPLALVEFVVRIALDAEGQVHSRRLSLGDMPPRSRLVLDVRRCPYPTPSAALELVDAARRGVRVEVEVADPLSARNWHELLTRTS